MKQLVIDVQADDRPLAGGGTVADKDPAARRCRFWLYAEGVETPAFRGEVFVSVQELEAALAGRVIIEELVQFTKLSISFSGVVPEVPPEPKAAKLAKILRSGLILFR